MILDFNASQVREQARFRKKKATGKMQPIKSIDYNKDKADNLRLLEDCHTYWRSLENFRLRRIRSRRYMRGDQYSDMIPDPENEGRYITEKAYIQRQGKVPLKQNFIRQYVRNMVGQFRSNQTDSIVVARSQENATVGEMLTNTIQCCLDVNQQREIDARNIEELIISGLAVGKVSFRYDPKLNREEGYIENVNPNRMFFNTDIEDIRGNDIRVIGQLIDKSIDEIVAIFANSQKEEEEIRAIYAHAATMRPTESKGLSAERLEALEFLLPDEPYKCRVIEVWEQVGEWRTYVHDYLDGSYVISELPVKFYEQVNADRLAKAAAYGIPEEEVPLVDAKRKYEVFWRTKYLAPTGECLFEAENPYAHEEHPFVLCIGSMLDGEIWGTVEDTIDQQRYINRLITLIDFAMGVSAKGLLMIPETAITKDTPIHKWASEWRKVGGVVTFKPKAGEPLPQQISTNSTNFGAHELLSIQMQIIQQVSGVSGAIQGFESKSHTPSSLYAQQAQNASINFKDLFDTFGNYRKNRDSKLLKVLCQFYKEKRFVDVAGRSYMQEAKWFDPIKVRNLDYTVVSTQGIDTPVYRAALDDTLFQLLNGGAIDIEMYLENSSLPFATKLLESVRKKKEAMQQGQPTGGFTPEDAAMAAQVEEGAANAGSPEAMAMIRSMMASLNNGEQYEQQAV